MIAGVVAPVLHTYVPPPLAVRTAVAPAHMIPSLLVVPEVSATKIAAAGNGLTVMVVLAVAVHPFALVTVTVYVVVPAGVTVIAEVVAPVLHAYVPPPLAVSKADAPAQMVPSSLARPEVSATDILAVGGGFTVMSTDVALEHVPTVTVTV